jgi:acylphosphatase
MQNRNLLRVRVFVSGRVQGVFFRAETKSRAQGLGIKGWVRNISDGRVEALLEGEKEKVEQLIAWMKKGPMFAKVEKVEIFEEEYKGEFQNFEIRY